MSQRLFTCSRIFIPNSWCLRQGRIYLIHERPPVLLQGHVHLGQDLAPVGGLGVLHIHQGQLLLGLQLVSRLYNLCSSSLTVRQTKLERLSPPSFSRDIPFASTHCYASFWFMASWPLPIDNWLLTPGSWPLPLEYWLLALGSWPLALGP